MGWRLGIWVCRAYHKVVLMVWIHESLGSVDVLAAVKGPALPSFLLSELGDNLLTHSDRQGAGGGSTSLALLAGLRPTLFKV